MLDLVRRLLKRFLLVSDAAPEAPLGEHPEVFRASRKHLTYLVVGWALKHGFVWLVTASAIVGGIVAVAVGGHDTWIAWVLGIGALVWLVTFSLVGYASIRLDWDMRWYILTDRSLRIREGIVFMREVTLTLANVQELKVSQGPIQRALGITDLVVDTAGGGASAAAGKASIYGHHGILRGVDGGGELRAKIEARVKQRRGAGLGDPDDHADHAPASGAAGSGDLVTALRAVRDEARRLRGVVVPTA